MTITAPSKSKRTVTSRNTKAVFAPDFQGDATVSVPTETWRIATTLVSVQSWTVTPLWSPAASATDAQPRG